MIVAKAKRIFKAAAWFCDGLPPETEYGRDIAEMNCKAKMGRASTKHRVKIGPLRWSELKPGDEGPQLVV